MRAGWWCSIQEGGTPMKRPQWGPYAIALSILVVGLVWVGVPAGTLLIGGLVLACPLMMFVMMRGMQGHQSGPGDRPAPPADDANVDPRPVQRSTHE
jgi:hypothetical protein